MCVCHWMRGVCISSLSMTAAVDELATKTMASATEGLWTGPGPDVLFFPGVTIRCPLT